MSDGRFVNRWKLISPRLGGMEWKIQYCVSRHGRCRTAGISPFEEEELCWFRDAAATGFIITVRINRVGDYYRPQDHSTGYEAALSRTKKF